MGFHSDDYSEALVVGGDIIGETFYGDGSQLTNISKVDYYWFMHGNNMTVEDFALGIGAMSILSSFNLNSGLRLASDGSTVPGTLSYESGDCWV